MHGPSPLRLRHPDQPEALFCLASGRTPGCAAAVDLAIEPHREKPPPLTAD